MFQRGKLRYGKQNRFPQVTQQHWGRRSKGLSPAHLRWLPWLDLQPWSTGLGGRTHCDIYPLGWLSVSSLSFLTAHQCSLGPHWGCSWEAGGTCRQLNVEVEWTTTAPRAVVWAGHASMILFTRINHVEKKLVKCFFFSPRHCQELVYFVK